MASARLRLRACWIDALVLLAFAGLTLGMTYPLGFRLANSVRDPGDPLLNAWIMAWDVHAALGGSFGSFFDANIFFPHERTLAYSEFLIPQAILGAPVLLLSGNPILAYNVVFFLCVVGSGFSAYLLARYLTGDRIAGVFAGIAFAFCPFFFDHWAHIQVLSAAGIPLALLYLHRFFEDERPSRLVCFVLVYALQILANGYYGLFLTLYCGLLILGMGWTRGWLTAPRFWAKWAVAGVVVVLLVAPFYYQYLAVRQEMGFVRTGYMYARPWNYLAVSHVNVPYGDLLAVFHSVEAALFPGLTVLALAVFGFERSSRGPRGRARRAVLLLRRLLVVVIALDVTVLAYVALVAPIQCSVLGVEITVSGTRRAEIVLFYALLAGLVLHLGPTAISQWLSRMPEGQRIYIGVALLSMLFTFGPVGPYAFLYSFVPGFDGLRVASRFGVFAMLSLAVLAAYGLAKLRRDTSGRARVMAALLPLLVCGEFLSVPVPMVEVPVKQEIPRVYRWLAEQPGDGPVVELPISAAGEFLSVYYSTYHWKKLVNGTSGYFPDLYLELGKRCRGFPSVGAVSDLEDLGVRYAVVDIDALEAESAGAEARFSELGERLRLVESFDRTRVYELVKRKEAPEFVSRRHFEKLDRRSWSVLAQPNAGRSQRAIDGDPGSWWRVGNAAEAFFQVDLGAEQRLAGVILKAARPGEYPRDFRIEVSRDGTSWQSVARDDAFRPPILGFLRPLEFRVELEFEAVSARHVRLLQMASPAAHYWSIAEIELIAAPPPPWGRGAADGRQQ